MTEENGQTVFYEIRPNRTFGRIWPDEAELPYGQSPQARNRADLYVRVEVPNLSKYRFDPTGDNLPFEIDTRTWEISRLSPKYFERLAQEVETRMQRSGLTIIFY